MFFLTKTVEIRWNWRCKIFSLKIRRCKIFDKSHVCDGEDENGVESDGDGKSVDDGDEDDEDETFF